MPREFAAKVALVLSSFLAVVTSAAGAPKPNLVLITLDSVRADRIGFLGTKAGLTPNLDRLAAQSIVFEQAYAQAPGTVVSHATILTGSYPQSTGMSEIGGTLTPSLPYLPDLLRAQGYRTAAFVSSIDLDPVNGLVQGFDRGFQKYDADDFRPVIPGDARPPVTQRRGRALVARALAWLASNAQHGPFFLWVHLRDADVAARASYNAGVAAADTAIGELTEALHKQKIDGNTVIVVVADHGQSLGAHGEDAHGIFLYNETIHVPLLIRLPEAQPAAKRVSAKVPLVDIAPTLLEIAGIPVPSQMQGQSLVRIAKSGGGTDSPVYSRSDFSQSGFGWSPLESWRAGKYLYIRAPRPELYDIDADPGAVHNLAQSSKATLDTVAAQLDGFDRNLHRNDDRRLSGEADKSPNLSSSDMQRLASLGYVGLQKSSAAAASVAGIDPKDKIATANRVVEVAPSGLAPANAGRAIAALAPVVAADSNLYLAEYTLGVALVQEGRYAEAAQHLHKAIELQPGSSWAQYEIGATLVRTGDFKTTVVHLEIAAERLPVFAPVHAALAQAYDHLGRTDDAKRELGKAGQK
jgi:choline-sulfatase